MLFGKIIQHPKSHFFPGRRGKFLDPGTIKSRADPFFWIQPGTSSFFLLTQKITPEERMSGF